MKRLTVYKASAGSGKTYTLAIEYIKLLMMDPYRFRRTLAVTFTNKATEEMKSRILSQLYGIWQGLDDSRSYTRDITEALGITEAEASRRAGEALNCLLHKYNHFRVETIDSFFQTILRNLARELDLTANMKVDLRDAQVEERAVDLMIESLEPGSDVLGWIIGYVMSNIEKSRSWNVIGQIKKFGQTIFSDEYKGASKELAAIAAQRDSFKDYARALGKVQEEADTRMARFADEFDGILASNGLTADSLAGKSRGVAGYFARLRGKEYSDEKCRNKSFEGCMESPDAWAPKKSRDRDAVIGLARDVLMGFLEKVDKERHEAWKRRNSVEVTLRHINELRLLNSIEEKVRSLNDEANRFLLSDTQDLLRRLIDKSDSPFIYERTGTRLEHIMIDEFQDTSAMQWDNFKVLLLESMSHAPAGKANVIGNLIVGDVKQSIYRWRNGDWRLLNGIEGEFPGMEGHVETRGLNTNYRSRRNIVDFNNAFFTLAAGKEMENETDANPGVDAGEIGAAYRDVAQRVPGGRTAEGLARIRLLAGEDTDGRMHEEVLATVDRLLSSGVRPKDIAILVRANKHIPAIADHFMMNRPDVKIVSDEAFSLGASLAVRVIVMALRLVARPQDLLTRTALAMTYQRVVLGNSIDDADMHAWTRGADRGDTGRLDALLPGDFAREIGSMGQDTLLGMVERAYSAFGLERLEGQGAYVCAFYDSVVEFTSENAGDLDAFLREWDGSIKDKKVQGEEADGIRILSIHKSKGLEFGNVILPFCDWKTEGRGTLWCKPAMEPFNRLPIVPVDYGKGLRETIYGEDYKNEHIQNTVDNLNLLYVAFTRASDNLFVLAAKGKGKGARSSLIEQCLEDGLQEALPGSTLEDGDEATFEYGTLFVREGTGREDTRNVFLRKPVPCPVSMKSHGTTVELRQRNMGQGFTIGEDGSLEEGNTFIRRGNVLHELFSRIRTPDDMEGALDDLGREGILTAAGLTVQGLRRILDRALGNETAREWFAPRWKVFNECNISFWDEREGRVVDRRPDRVITDGERMVVIDFKFGNPRPEHREQVAQYMDLLASMGYHRITGHLWYVYLNRIEDVEPTTRED